MPTPYYDKGGITIYHADCRDVLPTLPAGSVDFVLTDPPYGVRHDQGWDIIEEKELSAFTASWVLPCRQICPYLVSFFSTTRFEVMNQLCRAFYPFVRLMIWDKPLGSQYAGSAQGGIWYAFEPIFACGPGFDRRKSIEVANMIRTAREKKRLSRGGVDMVMRGKKTGLCYRWEEAACLPTLEQAESLCELLGLNGDFVKSLEIAWSGPQQATHRDVFSFRTVTDGNHPCEKPTPLLAALINAFTDAGQTVLDPFMGSGTTLRAAKDAGLKAVGIEIEERYCEIAARRLEQEVFAWGEAE